MKGFRDTAEYQKRWRADVQVVPRPLLDELAGLNEDRVLAEMIAWRLARMKLQRSATNAHTYEAQAGFLTNLHGRLRGTREG